MSPPTRLAVDGIGLGTCVHFTRLNDDEAMQDLILDRFTCLTPEYSLQWSSFEPSPGKYQFAVNDGLVDFAGRKGLSLNGHALLWEQGTPGWGTPRWVIERLHSSKADWSLIERRFQSVLSRYGSAIPVWNVVNEPIETTHRSDGLRNNVFLRAFGPDYVERALLTAAEIAPEARLMINEYSLEYDNPTDRARRKAVLKLIERLKRRDVPIHQFGLQGHLDLRKGSVSARSVAAFVRDLAGLGLDIQVTELDVQESDLTLSLARRDRRVADETEKFLSAVLSSAAVKAVTTWGVSDKDSWLNVQAKVLRTSSKSGEPSNRGLPFDDDFKPKLMAEVLADATADRSATASIR